MATAKIMKRLTKVQKTEAIAAANDFLNGEKFEIRSGKVFDADGWSIAIIDVGGTIGLLWDGEYDHFVFGTFFNPYNDLNNKQYDDFTMGKRVRWQS